MPTRNQKKCEGKRLKEEKEKALVGFKPVTRMVDSEIIELAKRRLLANQNWYSQ